MYKSKIQMIKIKNAYGLGFLFGKLRFWVFGIVSDFGFRA